ncbi:nuclear pore complex protein nup205 [Phtheirospermum japonicum]|uniref:Nuclear pore complex protein nup205 n=1 Tax=Phtheirospermum japonicum TaxID=374723 RepID=A0A830CPK7_9LAMI|nr:nuclear pore complex protein nup205 [Phtheirospermum japonicum]
MAAAQRLRRLVAAPGDDQSHSSYGGGTESSCCMLSCNLRYGIFNETVREKSNLLPSIRSPNRAWFLKLLAVELHSTDMMDSNHREACQSILIELFGQRLTENGINYDASSFIPQNDQQIATIGSVSKSKVLELLDVVQFESPDITQKSAQFVSSLKYSSLADDILSNTTTSERDVYYHSERGDRHIDLASFRDELWQKCNLYNSQMRE